MTELPTIPLDAKVIELSETHAPKSCSCGDGAEFYVFVTDEKVAEAAEAEVSPDEWPVNEFLCRQHFGDAPRVESVAAHPSIEV